MSGESLFVFGALRTGGGSDHLLAGFSRRVGTVAGELWVLPGGAPVLVRQGTGRVVGELVEGIPLPLLSLLDHLEGVRDGVVRRERVEVRIGLRNAPAWVWVAEAGRARAGRRHAGPRWVPTQVR
jgi:gamma-glutamylcyclotransferase (GGCT)/AIG2-like uncharacterized protein YtfP